MALTGRFDADFNEFFAACKQAELSLKGFDAGTKQVESSLNRMVDNFTGRQVISEATLMAEAVTRIGSPARLTRDELQQMGAVAEQAVEKLNRIGGEVPPKVQALADAASRARGQTSGLGTSLREFDGVLASVGINIGPEIRGLEDLATAASKGATGLGAIATAGLTVGAGVAGWKLGRVAAEFLDLDEKIGDVTAKLLGFGDVAGQKAALEADLLAKASKTAGFEVKELGLAMMINADSAKVAIDANTKFGDQLARMEGPEKSRKQLEGYHKEIELLKSSGLLPALTKDINSHAFSLGELADRYRVSSQAMGLFAVEAEKVGRIEQSNADKWAKLRADFQKAELQFEDTKRKSADDAKKKLADEIHEAVRLQQAAHDMGIAFDDAQRLARLRTEETTKALKEEEWQALRVQRAITTVEYDLSTESGRKRFHELNPSAVLSQAATPEYFKSHTIEDAIREGLLDLYAGYRRGGAAGGMVPGPQIVSSNLIGMGMPPSDLSGTTVQPLVTFPQTSWGGGTINVIVSNSGVFDVASARKLGDLISQQLMLKLKMGRQLGAG